MALLVANTTYAGVTTRYSGERAITCYQAGAVIISYESVYRLRESRDEDGVRFEFEADGVREDLTLTGDAATCVVTNPRAERNRTFRVHSGHRTLSCQDNGVAVFGPTRIHGLNEVQRGPLMVYSFYRVDRPAPRQEIAVMRASGRCEFPITR